MPHPPLPSGTSYQFLKKKKKKNKRKGKRTRRDKGKEGKEMKSSQRTSRGLVGKTAWLTGPGCGQVVCSPGRSCWSHWKERKEEASNHRSGGLWALTRRFTVGFWKISSLLQEAGGSGWELGGPHRSLGWRVPWSKGARPLSLSKDVSS